MSVALLRYIFRIAQQNALVLVGEYFGQLGLALRKNLEELVVAVDLIPLHKVSQFDILILPENTEELSRLLDLFEGALDVFVLCQLLESQEEVGKMQEISEFQKLNNFYPFNLVDQVRHVERDHVHHRVEETHLLLVSVNEGLPCRHAFL